MSTIQVYRYFHHHPFTLDITNATYRSCIHKEVHINILLDSAKIEHIHKDVFFLTSNTMAEVGFIHNNIMSKIKKLYDGCPFTKLVVDMGTSCDNKELFKLSDDRADILESSTVISMPVVFCRRLFDIAITKNPNNSRADRKYLKKLMSNFPETSIMDLLRSGVVSTNITIIKR